MTRGADLEGPVMDRVWEQYVLAATTIRDVLSETECDDVKRDALRVGLSRSTVIKGKRIKPSRARTSNQAVLERTPEREWLYERVLTIAEAVNAEFWRFSVTGIENMQVLRYKPTQRFKWHYDTYPGSLRKLTCVINLSSPQSYWRGGLRLKGAHKNIEHSRLQGAATLFPPFIMHKAAAPWLGERWVLVAWLTGPAWA